MKKRPTISFDWQATVAQLSNSEAAAKDIVGLFINTLTDFQSKINLAYQTEHEADLKFHVHKLHGGCCYVSVPRLKFITNELDQLLNSQPNSPQVHLLIDDLNNEITEVLVATAPYLNHTTHD